MKIVKYFSFLLLSFIIISSCTKKYGYEFENGYTTTDFPDTVDVEIDTTVKIDRSKYIQASVFPGVISHDEPRLEDYVVDIDLDYVEVKSSDLRISVAPGNWVSTGMWAPAGELFTIVIPEGIYGLQAQVGAHTDNLTGKEPLKRDPIIYNRKQLFPGINHVRNLYGGHVYILPPRPLGKIIPVTFTGTVKAPDFFLGETTDAEWHEMIKETSVPFFELVGKRIVFTLEVAKLKNYPIPSPTALMETWDKTIQEGYWDWTGLVEGNPNPKHRAPFNKWRIVHDIQPSVGAQHSGYPVVAMNTNGYFQQAVTEELVKSSNWGTYHEIGHNMQQGSTWSFAGNGEVTNNLYSFNVSRIWGKRHSNMLRSWNAAKSYVVKPMNEKRWNGKAAWEANGPEPQNPSDDAKMSFYTQIFEYYGYDFMTDLSIAARDARFTAINDESKIDFYYERLSIFTGYDMERFMKEWGLRVSATSRNKISSLYPKLRTKVWLYDPYERSGGNELIVEDHSKAGWTAEATNAQNGYPASNLIDGNIETIWHSCYNNCIIGSSIGIPTPLNPLHLTISTNGSITADGFYFSQRQSNTNNHSTDIGIEISSNGIDWEDLGRFNLQAIMDKQYITLPNEKTFSYFRVILDTPPFGASNPPGTEKNVAFGELGAWSVPN